MASENMVTPGDKNTKGTQVFPPWQHEGCQLLPVKCDEAECTFEFNLYKFTPCETLYTPD